MLMGHSLVGPGGRIWAKGGKVRVMRLLHYEPAPPTHPTQAQAPLLAANTHFTLRFNLMNFFPKQQSLSSFNSAGNSISNVTGVCLLTPFKNFKRSDFQCSELTHCFLLIKLVGLITLQYKIIWVRGAFGFLYSISKR